MFNLKRRKNIESMKLSEKLYYMIVVSTGVNLHNCSKVYYTYTFIIQNLMLALKTMQ